MEFSIIYWVQWGTVVHIFFIPLDPFSPSPSRWKRVSFLGRFFFLPHSPHLPVRFRTTHTLVHPCTRWYLWVIETHNYETYTTSLSCRGHGGSGWAFGHGVEAQQVHVSVAPVALTYALRMYDVPFL